MRTTKPPPPASSSSSTEEESKHDALWKTILAKRCPEPDAVQALKKAAPPGTKPLDRLRPSAEARVDDLFWGMGETLLHLAARMGNADAAKLLLSQGAGVNVVSRPSDPAAGCTGTALHAACSSGAVDIVRMLLEAKADRRPAKCGEGSALHIACAHGVRGKSSRNIRTRAPRVPSLCRRHYKKPSSLASKDYPAVIYAAGAHRRSNPVLAHPRGRAPRVHDGALEAR